MERDNNGLTDNDVTVVVLGPNDDVDEALAELRAESNLPEIPNRPADSADKKAWVEYCVSLGADRNFLTKRTRHTLDADARLAADIDPHTKEELIELAGRLGG